MFVFVPLLFQVSKTNAMLALITISVGRRSRALFAITFGEEVLGSVIAGLLGGTGKAYRLDIELLYIFQKTFRFIPKTKKEEAVNEDNHSSTPNNS
jgi:hypothetical protein